MKGFRFLRGNEKIRVGDKWDCMGAVSIRGYSDILIGEQCVGMTVSAAINKWWIGFGVRIARPLNTKVAAKTSLNKRKPKRSGKAGGRTASAVR